LKDFGVIVPVYKEDCDCLKGLISDLLKVFGDKSNNFEVIIVFDGNSGDYLGVKEFFNDNSYVKFVAHKFNKGYGSSLKTGIINSSFENICIIDSDNTYPPEEFGLLIDEYEDVDMVIGLRDKKGVPFIRRLPKWFLRLFAGFMTNHKIPDLNSGMRIFKKSVCEIFWKLYPKKFSFTSTLTMGFLTNDYVVKWVPINYYKRLGKSHINPVKDTLGFISLIGRLALYFNPLRFFMPLSLIIGVLAVLRGLRDYITYQQFGGLTLVLFFMAFQVFFFGLIAEIINRKL